MQISLNDEKLAAIIVFLIAGFGMICHWFIVFNIRKIPSLQNAFGRVTAFQSLSEAIVLTAFSLLGAPMVIFDFQWMMKYSGLIGHILLMTYDICLHCHLVISLNRLTAIVFPVQYNDWFSTRRTYFYVFIAYSTGILLSIIHNNIYHCPLYYEPKAWGFIYPDTPVCHLIEYLDFLKFIGFVVIIVVIDLLALLKVNISRNSVYGADQTTRRSHKRREINFLKQACLQAAVFASELFVYYVIADKLKNMWAIFVATTICWIMVHMCDGLITIYFNKGFMDVFSSKKIVPHPSSIGGMTTAKLQLDDISRAPGTSG